VVERPLIAPSDVRHRQPTEADHRRLARLVREWWDEQPPRLERLWIRHFGPTSLLAENADGRPLGIAIGFAGGADPSRGVLYLVAVAPEVRRRGVGRELVGGVEAALKTRGVASVEAVVWPGNRAGFRFLEGIGYVPTAESAAARLYGLPAIPNYDGEGDTEDRSVLERTL
jgi:ribosomal protein S18 acetylase RimI-like enzyme